MSPCEVCVKHSPLLESVTFKNEPCVRVNKLQKDLAGNATYLGLAARRRTDSMVPRLCSAKVVSIGKAEKRGTMI